MARSTRWVLALVLALDLLALGWQGALQQLRLVVETRGPGTLELDDGVRRTLAVDPAPEPLRLTILNATAQGATSLIEVPALTTAHRARLFDASTYTATPGFSVEGLREGGVWRSSTSGASLSWQGRVSGLFTRVPCGRDRGVVCIEGTGLERACHDLSSCSGDISVDVISPRRLHTALIPLWRSGLTLSADQPLQIERLELRFGHHVVLERPGMTLEAAERIELPALVRLGALGAFIGNGALLLLQVLLLVVVSIVLGATVVTPFVDRLGLLEALLLSFFAGQGLMSNLTTSLFWFVPTTVGSPVVAGVLAVISVFQLARGGARRWRAVITNVSADERARLLTVSLFATVTTLLVAAPALTFPGWFVGHGYTDSMDYPTWASLAQEAPLDRGLAAIRFQDFVRVSVTAQTLGVDTVGALGPQLTVLWWVLPFLGLALLRRFGVSDEGALIGAALAGHGLCFWEIATQCYLPQYEVAHFAVAGLWAAAWLLGEQRERSWQPELAVACVFAASVGLYPYQAFSVMGFGVAVVAAAAWRRQSALLLMVGRVGLFTALVTNLNLEVVFDFGQGSMQHRAALNAIGRGVVFPWYASPEARAILAGTDDFVRTSALREPIYAEVFGGLPKTGRRFAALEAFIGRLAPAFTWVMLGVAAGALWLMGRRRDVTAFVALATLGVPLIMTFGLMRSDDVYFWVKSLMTFSALMVVPFVGAVGSLAASSGRGPRWLGVTVAVGFVALSLRTSWFDTLAYLISRESPALAATRTHLPVHTEALSRLQAWVQTQPAHRRVVFVGTLHDRYWTDGDIITYNRLLAFFEGHEVRYGDDVRKRYTRSRQPNYVGPEALGAFDVMVRFDDCAAEGFTSVLVTDLFCVLQRGQSTR